MHGGRTGDIDDYQRGEHRKFGKLENQKYQFAPQINVIYGANESGKSTLMQFLKAMLFGLEKQG